MSLILNEETLIIVDEGDTFFGTLSHWRDVFFSNPDEQSINDFCYNQGMVVEFRNAYVCVVCDDSDTEIRNDGLLNYVVCNDCQREFIPESLIKSNEELLRINHEEAKD